MQIPNKKNNQKSAFSLVEISVVMVIIGLLVTGIIGGQALMNYGTMSKARALTNSAPVSAIEGVQLWLETTSKKSFATQKADSNTEVVEDTGITTWSDINPQGLAKKNATQPGTPGIKPTYKTSSINGLPTMRFNGVDQYFILPDGTVPPGNEPYTVFIVSRLSSGTAGALISAGDTPANNALRLVYTTSIAHDIWVSNDLAANSFAHNITQAHIFTFRYNNATGVGRHIYVDGNIASSGNTNVNRATLSTGNRIGAMIDSGSETLFLNGDIGEIIVYNVALDNIDRASIENYLGQKWGINVAS